MWSRIRTGYCRVISSVLYPMSYPLVGRGDSNPALTRDRARPLVVAPSSESIHGTRSTDRQSKAGTLRSPHPWRGLPRRWPGASTQFCCAVSMDLLRSPIARPRVPSHLFPGTLIPGHERTSPSPCTSGALRRAPKNAPKQKSLSSSHSKGLRYTWFDGLRARLLPSRPGIRVAAG